MRLLVSSWVSIFCATLLAAPLFAHEFWLEPIQFQVEIGDPIEIHFRNGQEFKGGSLSWFDRRIARSEMRMNDSITQTQGRSGDLPAIQTSAAAQGLLTFVHQTTMQTLTYRDPAQFEAFVAHKDLDPEALRNPEYPLSEGYRRFAKSLIGIGHSAGADEVTGLEIEFVARKNPYVADLTDGLPFQLFYQDQPHPNAQVEVFDRAPDGTVKITLLRTDASGHVTLPVQAGHHYLVDAVILRRPSPDDAMEHKIEWESLWASTTFAVPN